MRVVRYGNDNKLYGLSVGNSLMPSQAGTGTSTSTGTTGGPSAPRDHVVAFH